MLGAPEHSLERVYGRLSIDDLANRITQELREDGGSWLGGASRGREFKLGTCIGAVDDVGERCETSAVTTPAEMVTAAAR